MGFVSKKMAQQLLMAKPPGTFLLRYSDGELGGISIVYNHPDKGMSITAVSSVVISCFIARLTLALIIAPELILLFEVTN